MTTNLDPGDAPRRPQRTPGQTMTSDRPCISERGLMVHSGTEVTYVARVAARAIRCRMADGSLEVLNPTCFPEFR